MQSNMDEPSPNTNIYDEQQNSGQNYEVVNSLNQDFVKILGSDVAETSKSKEHNVVKLRSQNDTLKSELRNLALKLEDFVTSQRE